MHIQVNTDNHIQSDERLIEYAREVIAGGLSRFQDRVTRIEAHLTDENGAEKAGADDKRCALEARMAGLHPVAVTHHASTVKDALSGAVDKLEKVLNGIVEKELEKRRG
jgi:ribosome-associated translation inhibitor RaiA